ncbi:hypothetical protein KW805_02320 [Candidatus Pacearchaeota archaeon]|nr:hypothetical protein [Candidatus Pacearchaeota archaeon]
MNKGTVILVVLIVLAVAFGEYFRPRQMITHLTIEEDGISMGSPTMSGPFVGLFEATTTALDGSGCTSSFSVKIAGDTLSVSDRVYTCNGKTETLTDDALTLDSEGVLWRNGEEVGHLNSEELFISYRDTSTGAYCSKSFKLVQFPSKENLLDYDTCKGRYSGSAHRA